MEMREKLQIVRLWQDVLGFFSLVFLLSFKTIGKKHMLLCEPYNIQKTQLSIADDLHVWTCTMML